MQVDCDVDGLVDTSIGYSAERGLSHRLLFMVSGVSCGSVLIIRYSRTANKASMAMKPQDIIVVLKFLSEEESRRPTSIARIPCFRDCPCFSSSGG